MRSTCAFALACCFAQSAFSQFWNLSTTDDGLHLYFSSPYRMAGAIDQFPHSKIFRLTPAGFELFAQAENQGLSTGSPRLSNWYLLSNPSVSGGGDVLTYGRGRDCAATPSGCSFIRKGAGTLARNGLAAVDYDSPLQVSRNGRFVLGIGPTPTSVNSAVYPTFRIDLQDGEQRTLPKDAGYFSVSRSAITSSGKVYLVKGPSGPIVVWDGDQVRVVETQITEQIRNAWISANGAVLVYSAHVSGATELRAFRVDTMRESVLARSAAVYYFDPYSVSMTNDGNWISFIDPENTSSDIVLIRPDGGGPRRMSVDDGTAEAVISGYGNVLYAATRGGRLLRIDPVTGKAEQLASAITQHRPLGLALAGDKIVPGSLIEVRWSWPQGRQSVASSPLPTELETWTVLVDDRKAPIWLVAPDRLLFQLPWETTLEQHTLWLSGGGHSFEPGFKRVAVERDVQSVSGGYEGVVYHQDFTPVSPDHPAEPGAVVHTFLTGVGAVEPLLETGVASPLSPLSRARPIECTDNKGNTIDQLFIGLAPQYVGVYQFSFRVPEETAFPGQEISPVWCNPLTFQIPVKRLR